MSAPGQARAGSFRVPVAALLCALGMALPCAAQTSASYKLTEFSFNSGGTPSDGMTLTSSSFQVGLAAVGDTGQATELVSPSFQVGAGFVIGNPPPGEVAGLEFLTDTDLVWDSERSAGTYNMYRAALNILPGDYGACHQPGIQSTHWIEPANPATGETWFYLVTVKSRLAEEGTMGYGTAGVERGNNSPCP